MGREFADSFAQSLIDEFDCSNEEAVRIAKHARRHHRNTGVARTPAEWVAVLDGIEANTVVQRWKQAVDADAGGISDG